MTVGDAIRALNETHCHQAGYHVSMHQMKDYTEQMATSGAGHTFMKQTFDWRYSKPDKEQYIVTLSAEEARFIGNAIELFDRLLFEYFLQPAIERIAIKMGNPEAEENEPDPDR